MKTSMLGEGRRRELVGRWPEVATRGVADKSGKALFPGNLVCLPAAIRLGSGAGWDVPGTVVGFAIGKDGSPSIVVHAPAWNGKRVDTWRTWIVRGGSCRAIGEDDARHLLELGEARGAGIGSDTLVGADSRAAMAQAWMQVMVGGVRTKGKVTIRPGDLVRLPRNVARNRGSQLHAAGTCLGYAVGLDGSPCIVVDAVGEDVPALTRWRTWVVRGAKCLVIDTKEAWRLESMYARDGRPRKRST